MSHIHHQGPIWSESKLPDDSTTVFPQVYEQRNDISSKVLVIGDDYSLDLVKASVLSDPVLLRVVTESGVEQRYVDGPYHERNLYQDTGKQASLILKPLRDGHYHVVSTAHAPFYPGQVRVSLRMQQLDTPGFIALIAIEMSATVNC
nr:uncharacterized protein LOC129380226 [Dermacentor andersoni]